MRRWRRPAATPQLPLGIAPRRHWPGAAARPATDTQVAAEREVGLKRGGDAAGDSGAALTLRQRAFELLRRRDATADEVAAALGESVLAIRPRICELAALGLVRDSGLRRANASGRMAIVWEVVP